MPCYFCFWPCFFFIFLFVFLFFVKIVCLHLRDFVGTSLIFFVSMKSQQLILESVLFCFVLFWVSWNLVLRSRDFYWNLIYITNGIGMIVVYVKMLFSIFFFFFLKLFFLSFARMKCYFCFFYITPCAWLQINRRLKQVCMKKWKTKKVLIMFWCTWICRHQFFDTICFKLTYAL